jgi:battenin
VVVGAAAESLAESFDESHLIGAILWANVALGTVLKVANALAVDVGSHQSKIYANVVMGTAGVVMVAMSRLFNFTFAICGIVLVGGMSSLGESVILGLMHEFDPKLTGAWSSGTGMAGIGGTLFYLALYSGAGLSNEVVFLLLLPSMAIYLFTFRWVLSTAEQHKQLLPPHEGGSDDQQQPLSQAAADSPRSANAVAGGAAVREALGPRLRRAVRQCLHYAVPLTLVYFFEYAVSNGFAAISNPEPRSKSWFSRNSYEILAFCYQLGVLISRSSIAVVQFRRVNVLAGVQGVFFVLWLVHVMHNYIELWGQFFWMICVGLIGGAMYVNVFFFMMKDPAIADADRELCVNVTTIFYNFGIIGAAVFEIIADETFLSEEVKRSK